MKVGKLIALLQQQNPVAEAVGYINEEYVLLFPISTVRTKHQFEKDDWQREAAMGHHGGKAIEGDYVVLDS